MTAPEPDAALAAQVRAGDRAALEAVYVAHHVTVRAFARRFLGDDAAAEDVVHDTFLALPRAIRGFRAEGTLRAFLIGVALNHARRHIRTAIRRRAAAERLARVEELRPPQGSAAEDLARRQLARRLTTAMDALSLDHRAAFVLCEVEQRTSLEVAAILGVPEGTVRTRLFHAKRTLRALLAGEGAP